jgi:hypothetical protein
MNADQNQGEGNVLSFLFFSSCERETDVRAGDGGTWALQVRVANAWQQGSRSLGSG